MNLEILEIAKISQLEKNYILTLLGHRHLQENLKNQILVYDFFL